MDRNDGHKLSGGKQRSNAPFIEMTKGADGEAYLNLMAVPFTVVQVKA